MKTEQTPVASQETQGCQTGHSEGLTGGGTMGSPIAVGGGASQAGASIDYEKLATMVAGKLAPVFSPRKENDTRDHEVGQVSDLILEDGSLAMGGADIAAIDSPLESDYFKELAFMEEPMEIMLAETSDQNAENPVIVGNGGIFKAFFRGVPTVAKRKFVDCLIVKSSRVTTPEVLNGGGERTNVIRQHSAHQYPFTVIQDRSPKGAAWLRRRLAEVI